MHRNPTILKSLCGFAAGLSVLFATSAQAENLHYVYDALGRLTAVVDDKGETNTNVTLYRLDSASNRTLLDTTGSSASLVPIYRFLSGTQKHFYTKYFMEGSDAGFGAEGQSFILYRNSGNGFSPLYRCYVTGSDDHFLSADAGCEGTAVEGLVGYVSVANNGNKPLYRFFKSSILDHLITTDYQEAINAGYVLEGTLGYVAG